MKTAIYVRCSDEAGESATLETQKESCIKFCECQGWNEHEIYIDDGFSGATMNRPDFQRLLRDAESGRLSAVVCWRLDRLSRNIRDSVNLFQDLKEWGVNLKSVMDGFDLHSPSGKMMFNVLMTFADFERETITQRLLATREKYMRQGLLAGGQATYGYDYVAPARAPKEGRSAGWHLDESEAEVIARSSISMSPNNSHL